VVAPHYTSAVRRTDGYRHTYSSVTREQVRRTLRRKEKEKRISSSQLPYAYQGHCDVGLPLVSFYNVHFMANSTSAKENAQ
jgi:hypothetical protein